jgi:glycosyltransferase involved in cell wall biosynthesis
LSKVGEGADDERMAVLLVGQGPPTHGGIPTFVGRLIQNEWMRRRARFDFLNTTPPGLKEPGRPTIDNVRQALRDARGVLMRGRRADVVHLHLSPAPLLPLIRALFLVVAARLAGARVVLHAHSGLLHKSVRHRAYRVVLRITLALLHAFVVVSREAEAAVRPLGRRVVRIENGIDARHFLPRTKDPAHPLLAFVGTVCERKGLIDLADALQRVVADQGDAPQLRVAIVGDDRQEGPGVLERIRKAFVERGLASVEFLGAVEPDRVAGILSEAGIFCLPSHWEGFPLSLLEAMAAGAAVIATRVGDIPYVLDEGLAGVLVDVRDIVGLAHAIKRLASDREERDRLGEAARKRVEDQFTEDAMMERIYELYR